MSRTSKFVILITVAAILAGGGVLLVLHFSHEKEQPSALLSREDFRSRVIGKAPDEVLAALGKPTTTSQGTKEHYWYYSGRTRDPVTGKADLDVQVIFRNNVAVAVAF